MVNKLRILFLSALLISGYIMVYSASVQAATALPDRLQHNETLQQGESIASPNGRYILRLQTDQNLVLTYDNQSIWSTQTSGLYTDYPAYLTLDRKVELRTHNISHAFYTLWADWATYEDNTNNQQAQLVLQDDGNLVFYIAPTKPVWSRLYSNVVPVNTPIEARGATVSSPNGNTRLSLQMDGNLVLTPVSGVPRWSTKTTYPTDSLGLGYPRLLILQSDGNLVLYNPLDGKPLWASHTRGKSVDHLTVQDDGNLVIYDKQNRPVWHP